MYIWLYTGVFMYMHIYVCMHVCMFVYIYIYYVYMYIYEYSETYMVAGFSITGVERWLSWLRHGINELVRLMLHKSVTLCSILKELKILVVSLPKVL